MGPFLGAKSPSACRCTSAGWACNTALQLLFKPHVSRNDLISGSAGVASFSAFRLASFFAFSRAFSSAWSFDSFSVFKCGSSSAFWRASSLALISFRTSASNFERASSFAFLCASSLAWSVASLCFLFAIFLFLPLYPLCRLT